MGDDLAGGGGGRPFFDLPGLLAVGDGDALGLGGAGVVETFAGVAVGGGGEGGAVVGVGAFGSAGRVDVATPVGLDVALGIAAGPVEFAGGTGAAPAAIDDG